MYQAGPEVHEIFKTLEEGKDQDFNSAVKALTEYFEPEKNVIYRTYLDKRHKAKKRHTVSQMCPRFGLDPANQLNFWFSGTRQTNED